MIWKANTLQCSKLNQRLFGKKTSVTKNGIHREYFYDGILVKWVDGKRVPLCEFSHFGPSQLCIAEKDSAMFVPKVLQALADLEIWVKTYGMLENELFTWR